MRLLLILLILLILVILNFIACSNDLDEVNQLFETIDTDIEHAQDVNVIYSDSARCFH